MKLAITFIFGALAIGIGAFGAHALENIMDNYGKEIFNTGSRYHFYHTFLMLVICLLIIFKGSHPLLSSAWYLSLTGIILFSGSLYLLATQSGHSIPTKILGPITPIGGLLFITAWILLIIYAMKNIN